MAENKNEKTRARKKINKDSVREKVQDKKRKMDRIGRKERKKGTLEVRKNDKKKQKTKREERK